jgi:hypothetical protein
MRCGRDVAKAPRCAPGACMAGAGQNYQAITFGWTGTGPACPDCAAVRVEPHHIHCSVEPRPSRLSCVTRRVRWERRPILNREVSSGRYPNRCAGFPAPHARTPRGGNWRRPSRRQRTFSAAVLGGTVPGASPSQRAWRNDAPSCRNSTKRLSSTGSPCLAERLRMGTRDLGIATRAPSSWGSCLLHRSAKHRPSLRCLARRLRDRQPGVRPRSLSWRYRPASALTTPLPVLVSSSRRQRLRFRDRPVPWRSLPNPRAPTCMGCSGAGTRTARRIWSARRLHEPCGSRSRPGGSPARGRV